MVTARRDGSCAPREVPMRGRFVEPRISLRMLLLSRVRRPLLSSKPERAAQRRRPPQAPEWPSPPARRARSGRGDGSLAARRLRWSSCCLRLRLGALFLGGHGHHAPLQLQRPGERRASRRPPSSLPFEDVAFNGAGRRAARRAGGCPRRRRAGTVVLVHGLNRSRIEMVQEGAVPPRAGLERAALRPAPPRRERRRRSRASAASRSRTCTRPAALARARSARARSCSGASRWAAAAATLAAAEDPAVAGARLRQQLPQPARHRRATTCSSSAASRWWLRVVPTWPVADEVAVLDRPARRLRPRRGGRRRPRRRAWPAGPALFVCNSGDRRMPPEIAFELKAAAGRPRAGAGGAGQQPRRRLARRDRRLRDARWRDVLDEAAAPAAAGGRRCGATRRAAERSQP